MWFRLDVYGRLMQLLPGRSMYKHICMLEVAIYTPHTEYMSIVYCMTVKDNPRVPYHER